MDKWVYNYLIELKTLWEKEKLLVTSNFSFTHNVFKSCLLSMRQNEYLGSKGIIDSLGKVKFRDDGYSCCCLFMFSLFYHSWTLRISLFLQLLLIGGHHSASSFPQSFININVKSRKSGKMHLTPSPKRQIFRLIETERVCRR